MWPGFLGQESEGSDGGYLRLGLQGPQFQFPQNRGSSSGTLIKGSSS